jgi:hypothetical protein
MKAAAVLLMTFGLACASAATASERVSDLDYLKANRCKGIAVGLASGDTASLDAMIKAQGKSRSDAVLQRADEEISRAKREAAKTDLKERLSAELSGPCLAYMGGGKEMAAGH